MKSWIPRFGLRRHLFCVLVAFFNLGDRRHFAFEESPNDCDIGTMHLGATDLIIPVTVFGVLCSQNTSDQNY